jgi:hypothetical protein
LTSCPGNASGNFPRSPSTAGSWDWIHAATRAVAGAIPGARYLTAGGQNHGVLNQPEAPRPVLAAFLA